MDAIGDYILFRNFIKELKQSEKFKNHKIILCGNIIWKDLAEAYDSQYISEFIWIDKKKFWEKSNWKYHYKMLFKIYLSGFETLILPNDTDFKMSNYLLKKDWAEKTISTGNRSVYFFNDIRAYSRNGNEDSDDAKKGLFQFLRNKNFVESITGEKINLVKPTLPVKKVKRSGEKYFVIFPGAGTDFRRWSAENFAELIKSYLQKFNYKILICGAKDDYEVAQKIKDLAGTDLVENFTGKTSLPELVELIAGSELLISNETCSVHIAAAVDTPVICISNGNHFGRFHPYPESITEFVKTIYPDEIYSDGSEFHKLAEKYHISSDLDINKIKPSQVSRLTEDFWAKGLKSFFIFKFLVLKCTDI